MGDDRGWLARALGTPILVWLGGRSYGIYMSHALARLAYYHAHKPLTPIDTPLNQTLWLIPYLLLTIGLAHLLHTRIGLPVALRVKEWTKARERRRVAAAAVATTPAATATAGQDGPVSA